MKVICEIAGKQYALSEGKVVRTFHLKDAVEGETVDVESVLLAFDEEGNEVKVGRPYLEGAKVTLRVLEHTKGPKIRVMKFRPKKRYRRLYGHRDHITYLKVEKIQV